MDKVEGATNPPNFIDVFEARAQSHSQEKILQEADRYITYQELDAYANYLADQLRSIGVCHQDKVGVHLPQGTDHIISILAIFKLGAIYIPLDTNYDTAKLSYIVKDTHLNFAILNEYKAVHLTDGIRTVHFSSQNAEKLFDTVKEPKRWVGDIAYIMYTSGSEGNPKGVVINHYGIVNLATVQIREFEINNKSVIFQYAAMNFDASVSEWATALLSGAVLCFPTSPQQKLGDALVNSCNRYGVTIITLPPSLLLWLPMDEFTTLKTIVLAGEKINTNLLERMPKTLKIFNAYGPTEATVCSSLIAIEPKNPINCIGLAIDNVQMHVLDDKLNRTDIGDVGQIFITGIGLAMRYWNDDEMTHRRYIKNPFYTDSMPQYCQKLYATGDFARVLSNGKLEYVGRTDQQIKLHGRRINLEEIETCILSSEIVRDVLLRVVVIEDVSELCAYIIFDNIKARAHNTNNYPEIIKRFLENRLSSYMIPQHIVPIESWNYNYNGKIDIESLPLPVCRPNYHSSDISLKGVIVEIWRNVLSLGETILNDSMNFFELGGDSIAAMKLRLEMKHKGYKLSIIQIYENPRLSEMVKVVQSDKIDIKSNASDRTLENSKLSPIQYWFFEQNFARPNHWNQFIILNVKEEVTFSHVTQLLKFILYKHDVFSHAFKSHFSSNVRIVNKKNTVSQNESEITRIALDIHSKDDYHKYLSKKADIMQTTLNYSTGDCYKFCFVQSSQGNSLIVVAHHLIIDAVSWHIILADLNHYANILLSGGILPDQIRQSNYQTWINSLIRNTTNYSWENEFYYWINYPIGMNSDSVLTSATEESQSIERSNLLLSGYGKIQSCEKINFYILLLSALYKSTLVLGYEKDFFVNLESHGRDSNNSIDMSELVGWCTALYPFYICRSQINSLHNIDILENIRRLFDQIPNHGIGFGILKYLKPIPEYSAALLDIPTPLICFNYLGQWSGQPTDAPFTANDQGLQFSSSTLNRQVHAIEINAYLRDSDFIMNLSYDTVQIASNKIEDLLNAFETFLLEVKDIGGQETVDDEKGYPLTPLQESIYLHNRKMLVTSNSTEEYIVQGVIKLKGHITNEKLKNAWFNLVNHYPSLNTYFKLNSQGVPAAFFNLTTDIEWTYIEMSPFEDKNTVIRKAQDEHKNKLFKLNQPPLCRQTLIKSDTNQHYFILTLHHIIADGWCTHIILKKLFELYQCSNIVSQKSSKLDFKLSSYFNWLYSQNKKSSLNYWKNLLDGAVITSIAQQQLGEVAPERFENPVFVVNSILDTELSQDIKKYSAINSITIATVLQSAWSILCSLYTGQNDVVFGYVLSNRHIDVKNIENALGVFAQTVPVRSNLAKCGSLRQLLELNHLQYTHTQMHSYCLLREILAASQTPNEQLFDTLLVIENFPHLQSFKNGNDVILVEETSWHEKTEYPLCCTFTLSTIIEAKIVVSKTIVSPAYAEQILLDLIDILKQLTQTDIDDISEIKRRVCLKYLTKIIAWNNTQEDYPLEMNLYELFRQSSIKHPKNIALSCDNISINYEFLQRYVDNLAGLIRLRILDHTQCIAILMPRSIECIVAMLAILKCGVAYLPIDTDLPLMRIEYILNHAKVNLALTVKSLEPKLNSILKAIVIDLTELEVSRNTSEPTQITSCKNNIANVIYTSGSTGYPKGVLTTQKGMVNRILWMQKYFSVSHFDKILHKTSISFDVSGWEIFLPLSIGAQCCIFTEKADAHFDSLNEFIEKNNITCAHFVPSLLSAWAQITNIGACNSLRHVFSSGEPLNLSTIQKFYTISKARLINLYGPTEASIDVTCWVSDPTAKRVLIGKPIANCQIYILGPEQNVQPLGVAGEIYIGGDCLARGYLNDLRLTTHRFIDVEVGGNNIRLYKTGDLGRYMQDGSIEYLGRTDNQIKLRGYRIELEEIEKQILSCIFVSNAVVVLHSTEKVKSLIAYILPNTKLPEDWKDQIKYHLKNVLPSYMIPEIYICAKNLPLMTNGKIDRAALTKYPITGQDESDLTSENALLSDQESKFLKICRKVLGHANLSINDKFLSVGGDSISAIIIANNASKIGIRLAINDIILSNSFKSLLRKPNESALLPCGTLKKFRQNILKYYAQSLWEGCNMDTPFYPLSPAQMGIMFHCLKRRADQPKSYIIHHIYNVSGKINPKYFKSVWAELLASIPALRAQFHWRKLPSPLLYHSADVSLDFVEIDNSPRVVQECILQAEKDLSDISASSLQKYFLIKNREGDYTFIWSHHHILFDGWSIQIIMRYFLDIYCGISSHVNLTSTQVLGIENYSEVLLYENKGEALMFWTDYLARVEPKHLLSQKEKSRFRQESLYSEHIFIMTNVIGEAITSISRRLGLTPNTIYQYSWGITLCELQSTENTVFGVALSGRNLDIENIDQLVGLFAHVVPVVVDTPVNSSLLLNNLRQHQNDIITLSRLQPLGLGEIYSCCKHNTQLFDSLYVFENYPLIQENKSNTDIIIECKKVIENNEYPLTITLIPGEKTTIRFSYNLESFSQPEIDKIAELYIKKLEELLSQLYSLDSEATKLCLKAQENEAL